MIIYLKADNMVSNLRFVIRMNASASICLVMCACRRHKRIKKPKIIISIINACDDMTVSRYSIVIYGRSTINFSLERKKKMEKEYDYYFHDSDNISYLDVPPHYQWM